MKRFFIGSDNLNHSDRKYEFISSYNILQILLILLFLASAITLAELPGMYQYAILAAVPAIVIAIIILKNVYLGVCFYYLFEFLRPVDFIPALRPLKIVMLIELITLISWLFYLIKNKGVILWDYLNNMYLGFIAVMGLTIITAVNNRYAFNFTQAIVVNFIIFVISTNIVNSFPKLNKLIWIILLAHVYHALRGIYNYAVVGYVSVGQRTSGTTGSSFIGDENDFALALVTMIPFVYFYFISAKKRSLKTIYGIVLMLFVAGVIISGSRGGFVGLLAVIGYCIVKSKRKLLGLVSVIILVMVAVMIAPEDYWKQVRSISDTTESTAQTRLNYWKAAVAMYVDNPIIGVGAGNGPIRMPEYVQGFRSSATQWGRTFHGTFPQVLAELGTLGIGLYLLMLIYVFRTIFVTRRRAFHSNDDDLVTVADGLTGALLGYLVSATFLSTAYYPQLWTLFVFTIILKYLPSKNASVAESLS